MPGTCRAVMKARTARNNEWIIPKALCYITMSLKRSILLMITLRDYNGCSMTKTTWSPMVQPLPRWRPQKSHTGDWTPELKWFNLNLVLENPMRQKDDTLTTRGVLSVVAIAEGANPCTWRGRGFPGDFHHFWHISRKWRKGFQLILAVEINGNAHLWELFLERALRDFLFSKKMRGW